METYNTMSYGWISEWNGCEAVFRHCRKDDFPGHLQRHHQEEVHARDLPEPGCACSGTTTSGSRLMDDVLLRQRRRSFTGGGSLQWSPLPVVGAIICQRRGGANPSHCPTTHPTSPEWGESAPHHSSHSSQPRSSSKGSECHSFRHKSLMGILEKALAMSERASADLGVHGAHSLSPALLGPCVPVWHPGENAGTREKVTYATKRHSSGHTSRP